MGSQSAADSQVPSAGGADHAEPRRSSVAIRAATVVGVLAITLSPVLISVLTGGEGWFSWRMFSEVNGDIRYEVVDSDGERQVELDGLSYWDRRAHTGTRNLEALCRAHPESIAARRVLDGRVDEEVRCP